MNPSILSSLTYGMFAIGTQGQNGPTASIVNTVIQISNSPLTVAVSVNHSNYTNEMIKKNGLFTVSVLSEKTEGKVIGALGYSSGKNTDKLSGISYKVLREGVPVIKEDICCWFLCRVSGSSETSTHTVFIAEVIAGSEEFYGTPMTYRYFHEVIKGKAPKNAPTYRPPEQDGDEPEPMVSYICTVCGYVHADGETPFHKLPESWECPICGAPKTAFKVK